MAGKAMIVGKTIEYRGTGRYFDHLLPVPVGMRGRVLDVSWDAKVRRRLISVQWDNGDCSALVVGIDRWQEVVMSSAR